MRLIVICKLWSKPRLVYVYVCMCNLRLDWKFSLLRIFQRNSSERNRFPAVFCVPGGWGWDCCQYIALPSQGYNFGGINIHGSLSLYSSVIKVSYYSYNRQTYIWFSDLLKTKTEALRPLKAFLTFALIRLCQLLRYCTLNLIFSFFLFLSWKDFRMTSMDWSRKEESRERIIQFILLHFFVFSDSTPNVQWYLKVSLQYFSNLRWSV